jgi:hypothetical protein
MGNFYGSQAQWRMWGVSRLAEREGFEPPIRLPVCRISSAVHSTTLPPLRGRQGVFGGYVSNARPLNKGDRSRREARFQPRSHCARLRLPS